VEVKGCGMGGMGERGCEVEGIERKGGWGEEDMRVGGRDKESGEGMGEREGVGGERG